MTTNEVNQWLWEKSWRAAEQWFALQVREPWASLYLWYKPQGGELAVAPEKPEGFELGDGKRIGPNGTVEQVAARVHEVGRRLPILTPEMAA